MNLALLLKQPLLEKYLLKQLAYYANGWYAFGGKLVEDKCFKNLNSSKAKLVIIAKMHYRQSWQSYASVSKKELQQIIALQKSNENPTATIFQVIKNIAIDGYEVKKITFERELLDLLGEKRLLIPETELFSEQNSQQPWVLSLSTPVGTLLAGCFAEKCTSLYAKGLVSSLDAFKLSSGIPAGIVPLHIDEKNYASFLFKQLVKQKVNRLYQKMAFNAKAWLKAEDLHLLYWAPLLTASAFYLITNSFLWFQNYSIESEMAEQGTEIRQLLENKSMQGQQSQLLQLLNDEFSKTSTVHEHWSLVYTLVENGMHIDRLTFANNLLSIRGKADNASKILAVIAKSTSVANASFKGAVRKSRGQETFTIELIPTKPKSLASKISKVDGDKAKEKNNEKAKL